MEIDMAVAVVEQIPQGQTEVLEAQAEQHLLQQ